MAQPKKTAGEIITGFELQVNDITELSASEELDLLQGEYQEICSKRPWNWLKAVGGGAILSDSNGYYIAAPDDFAYFVINNTQTNNAAIIDNNASPKVIFLVNGSTYIPWQIINYSDRRQYVNRSGYAYLDPVAKQIRFLATPPYMTCEFDYIKVPALLALSDYPLIPGQFHDILIFAMATSNDILQLSPKATSYKKENEEEKQKILRNMEWMDSQQYMD